jgi:hypothetical protein
MAASASVFRFEPSDQYNQTLAANVHPSGWVNPAPKHRYNLVLVGGGTAGLVTAAAAAGLGASVALVEKTLMGGDVLTSVACRRKRSSVLHTPRRRCAMLTCTVSSRSTCRLISGG